MNRNVVVECSEIPHKIKDTDEVVKTDLGRYSKIVKVRNQSNIGNCIKKLNKYEYLDKRDDKVKKYNLDNPTSLSSVKRKLRDYEEKVLYHFPGSVKEIFVTLTCKEDVTDISIIKDYYGNFIKELKQKTKFNQIEHIGLFEQTAEGCWHIHAFIKTTDKKRLFIPQKELRKIWGHNGVYVMQNLNTMQTLRHSKDKREERLERFRYFPKGERMYNKSKGITSPPKEKLLYGECAEAKSDEYKTISNKTYIIRNGKTYEIMNAVTTQMFKRVKTSTSQQKQDNIQVQMQVQILETKENSADTSPASKLNETRNIIKSKLVKVVVIITFIIFDFQILYKKFIYFWNDKL